MAKLTCQRQILLSNSWKKPESLFLQLEETSDEASSVTGRAASSCEMLKMAACTGKSKPTGRKAPLSGKKKKNHDFIGFSCYRSGAKINKTQSSQTPVLYTLREAMHVHGYTLVGKSRV